MIRVVPDEVIVGPDRVAGEDEDDSPAILKGLQHGGGEIAVESLPLSDGLPIERIRRMRRVNVRAPVLVLELRRLSDVLAQFLVEYGKGRFVWESPWILDADDVSFTVPCGVHVVVFEIAELV